MPVWMSYAKAKLELMKPRLYVYVSGPYSGGDRSENVANASRAAGLIRDAGHHPFVPHLFHFWDMVAPASYDEWMDLCLAWLPKCDYLVRLPGESPGSDVEVAKAKAMMIPVYELEGFLRDHG